MGGKQENKTRQQILEETLVTWCFFFVGCASSDVCVCVHVVLLWPIFP